MEEEFSVKVNHEGTERHTPEIAQICNVMGCQAFNERFLGTVKAVVVKEGGVITKQRLIWGEENDPKFNESQQKNAAALLEVVLKAVTGGGDPGECTVKITVKK